MRLLSLAPAVLVLALVGRADAGTILATSFSNPNGQDTMGPSPYTDKLGQQFTLTTGVTISSIDASLSSSPSGVAASELTMKIYNDSSNSIGTTLEGTDTSVSGTLGSTGSTVSFAFADVSLAAGTYWITLTFNTTPTGNVNWDYQGSADTTGAAGSINNYYYGSVINGPGNPPYEVGVGTPFLTTINGTIVPEPSSLVLALMGCLAGGVATIRRRSA